MSTYDKAQEKAISRVLSEHVEQGVPDDADVWSLVEKRLAEREAAQEPLRERRWYDWVIGVGPLQPQAEAGSSRRGVFRYVSLAAGLVGLVLLAVLSTVVISRLSHRQPTAQQGGDNAIVFSVTPVPDGVSPGGIHAFSPNGRDISGLAVANDGTFWIGDADNRLLHYSKTGDLLKEIVVSNVKQVSDIDVWGDNIWVLDQDGESLTIHKIAQDGTTLADYPVPQSIQVGTVTETLSIGLIGLRMGGEGQVLLERQFGAQYVQVVGGNGNLAVGVSDFPAGGKTYSIDNPFPKVIQAIGP